MPCRTIPTVVRSLVAAALVATLASPSARAAEHTWVLPAEEPGTVTFHSRAPLESFEGRTGRVEGRLALDPAALGDSLAIEVRVDLASLETGIGLRDRHMRENHLHTDRFPVATFRGGRVVEGAGVALSPGEIRRVVVAGALDLHGVVRAREIALDLERVADADGGPALRIRAEFPVSLGDHGIPRPGFLTMKLGEVQRVVVDLRAAPAAD